MTEPYGPGWLDDPNDASAQRWWDGQNWTPQRRRRPADAATPPQPPPSATPQWPPSQPPGGTSLPPLAPPAVPVRSSRGTRIALTVAAVVVVLCVAVFAAAFINRGALTRLISPSSSGSSDATAGSGPNKIILNGENLDMGDGKPSIDCYGGGGTQTLDLSSSTGQPRVEIDLANDDIMNPDAPLKVKNVTIVASGHTFTALVSEDANGIEGTKDTFVQNDRNWKVSGYVSGESLPHPETFEVDVTCP